MTRVATFLLRLYPRAWRMRYEEEVRALIEDSAPDLRAVAGLVRGAVVEWLHSIVDPAEHPLLAGTLRGLGGWFAASAAIAITAGTASTLLQTVAGKPPAWVGPAGALAVLVVELRAFAAMLGLGRILIGVHGRTLGFAQPLTRRQSRRWWSILWVAVTLGRWSGEVTFQLWETWMVACAFLLLATEAASYRNQARRELARLRTNLRQQVTEHIRLRALVLQNLASQTDVDQVTGEIARLNRRIRAAADAIRLSQPITSVESRPS